MVNIITFIKNDECISDVIGIILMVALTVAISAATALFFFGYMQSVNKPYMIEITASRLNPNTVEIMNRGGLDINMLDTSAGNPFRITIGGVNVSPGNFNVTIGSSERFNVSPGARIIISGVFKDDTEHILYDTSI